MQRYWFTRGQPNRFQPVPKVPSSCSSEGSLGVRACLWMGVALVICAALLVPAGSAVAWPASFNQKAPAPIPAQRIATVRVAVADVWRSPIPRSDWHRETQLLLGEQVLVLQVAGEWTRVVVPDQPSPKDPRGYPGWVRSSVLTNLPYHHKRQAVVMVRSAPLKAAPDLNSETLLEASLDTRLGVVGGAGDWFEVALPGGGTAWLLASWTRVSQAGAQDRLADRTMLVATARQLMGVPYLWGGTSAGGMDCSGFTYRVFHANGILIPRDSVPQSRAGRAVGQAEWQPGDLIFYAVGGPFGTVSHVGLYVGSELVLNASSEGSVRIGSVWSAGDKVYWGARRYWMNTTKRVHWMYRPHGAIE